MFLGLDGCQALQKQLPISKAIVEAQCWPGLLSRKIPRLLVEFSIERHTKLLAICWTKGRVDKDGAMLWVLLWRKFFCACPHPNPCPLKVRSSIRLFNTLSGRHERQIWIQNIYPPPSPPTNGLQMVASCWNLALTKSSLNAPNSELMPNLQGAAKWQTEMQGCLETEWHSLILFTVFTLDSETS